ncbi:8-oxo-dGTP diphosphatase [Azospirillaceae bacterium]
MNFLTSVLLLCVSGLAKAFWRIWLFWRRFASPLTLGVRALVIDAQGQVLLVRQSYYPGWHLPGGGVGRRESAAEAAKRELQEETGLSSAHFGRLFGFYARFYQGARDHVVVYVFNAESLSGDIVIDQFEVVEARFFPLDRLPSDINPGARRRIAEFLGHAPLCDKW